MQTTLAQFNETESRDAFSLQNSKLLKVELNQVTIQAKLGSMVAYQGDVAFEHSGSGGLGRMLKKAVSGEGTQLMKMTGSGEVFLADQAQDIHLIYLENDSITVNGPNLLAFDSGIDWDIKRVQGASSMMGGGLFNMSLQGTGWVAILSDGRDDRHQDRRQPQEPDRARVGRERADVLRGPGLGAGAALRGAHPGRGGPAERRRPRRAAQPVGGLRLDVHQVLGIGVVHDDLARRAVPAGLEAASAGLVPVRLAAGGARAPVGQQPQSAGQLAA